MHKNQPYSLFLVFLISTFFSATIWITGALTDIPDQFIEPGMGNTFTSVQLKDYLEAGTDCNTFSFTPMLSTGSAVQPQNCTEYQGYSENMTATVKFSFAGQTFYNHVDDYLIAYDESDNIVECATSSADPFNEGERLFFLNIQGGNTSYPIKFEFYSATYQQSYTIPEALNYTQDANIGSAINPVTILTTPLAVQINTSEELIVTVRDTTWRGRQCFTINASDCTGGVVGSDEVCFNVQNALCPVFWNLSNTIDGTEIFRASSRISATNTIETNANATYIAGDSVVLKAGFYAKAGSSFTASIGACEDNLGLTNELLGQRNRINQRALLSEDIELQIHPNPMLDQAIISFHLPKAREFSIHLFNQNGQLVREIVPRKFQTAGSHRIVWNRNALYPGVFYVVLQSSEEQVVQKLVLAR